MGTAPKVATQVIDSKVQNSPTADNPVFVASCCATRNRRKTNNQIVSPGTVGESPNGLTSISGSRAMELFVTTN